MLAFNPFIRKIRDKKTVRTGKLNPPVPSVDGVGYNDRERGPHPPSFITGRATPISGLLEGDNGKMDTIFERFHKIGIIPVVVLDDAKDAEPLGRALCEGGLPCAEVTFRTAAAPEAIATLARKFPEMLVGAGTVLTPEQVDRATEAGAKFIVSPGLDPRVVKHCLDKGIPVTPGTQTPSEMLQAMSLGLNVVKFFPAEIVGGLATIKAIAAACTDLRFVPTGGINAKNVRDYLAYDKILACGGSWMVKKDLVKDGKWDELTALVREAAGIVKEIRG